jgi:hypothetical protein
VSTSWFLDLKPIFLALLKVTKKRMVNADISMDKEKVSCGQKKIYPH